MQKYNAELNAQVKREQFAEQTEREAAKQNAITYRSFIKNGGSGSGTTRLFLGNDEYIDIPSKVLSEPKNISAAFHALPEEVRQKAFEDYGITSYSTKKQLTNAEMNKVLGEYMEAEGVEAMKDIWRGLARQSAGASNKQPGLGWGDKKSDNTNEVDW